MPGLWPAGEAEATEKTPYVLDEIVGAGAPTTTVAEFGVPACADERLPPPRPTGDLAAIPAAEAMCAYSAAVAAEDAEQHDAADSAIRECRALRRWRLYINGNAHLRELPLEIGYCTALRELDISRNPSLAALPDRIGRLSEELRLIDASATALTRLPQELCRLSSLRVLRLSHSRLSELPHALGELGALEELAVDNNRLRCIPASCRVFAAASHPLRVLTLHGNPLVGGLSARDTGVEPPPEVDVCDLPGCGRRLPFRRADSVTFIDIKGATRVPLLWHLCSAECAVALGDAECAARRVPGLADAIGLPCATGGGRR